MKADKADAAAFDMAELVRVAGGDTTLADELARLFLSESSEHMSRMWSAINNSDGPALKFAAHALKGSAASLTAGRVAVIAGRLEEMGVAGDMTAAKSAFAQLANEMTALAGMLELLLLPKIPTVAA